MLIENKSDSRRITKRTSLAGMLSERTFLAKESSTEGKTIDSLPGGGMLIAMIAGGFMRKLKLISIIFAVISILTACQPKYFPLPDIPSGQPSTGNKGEWDAYFEEGDGLSAETAYVISDIDAITSMRELIASGSTDFKGIYFKATDLDLTDNFTPIGTGELPFNGIFEGPSNEDRAEIQLAVTETDQEYVGLFGGLGNNAEVRYINVSGSVKNDTPDGRAGMIAGILGNNAIIEHCSVSGSVEAAMAGGLVGKVNAGGIIKDSANYADVTGIQHAGGITGAINGNSKEPGEEAEIPVISNCHNYGNVSSTSSSGTRRTGGIAGEATNAKLSHCYNEEEATVTGSYELGGISGQTTSGSIIEYCENRGTIVITEGITNPSSIGGITGGLGAKAVITDSANYATINIPAATLLGGIAGKANTGNIVDSYNAGNITGASSVGGIAGELSSSSTYQITEDFTASASNNAIITGSASNVGGIVGSMSGNSSIEAVETSKKITNSGEVNGNGNTGGIVGYAQSGCTISDTSNTGSITATGTATNDRAGGIIGYQMGATLSDSTNTGAITADDYAGGVVGFVAGAEGEIRDSENTGTVSGSYAGGILGGLRQVNCNFIAVESASGKTEGTNHGSFIGSIVGTVNIGFTSCYIDGTLLSNDNPITTDGYIGYYREPQEFNPTYGVLE